MRVSVAIALVMLTCACRGERAPAPPTGPSSVITPAPAIAAPVARLSTLIDRAGALVAIQGLSVVAFDASGSSGTGLRFGIDYGDGQGVDEPVGQHVYTTGGRTYKARLIVTDSLGRTDVASVDIPVRDVEGRWYQSFYNEGAKRYESRTLDIFAPAGRSLTGVYTHPEGWTTPFAGELVPERGVNLMLRDNTIRFTSPEVGGFNSGATTLNVRVRGGSADGQLLIFSAANGGY
jgi:hypothetical protein